MARRIRGAQVVFRLQIQGFACRRSYDALTVPCARRFKSRLFAISC